MAFRDQLGRAKSFLIRRSLIAALALFAPATAQAAGPWTELAIADLEAARQLILENHPGPVDRNNPGFRTWLDHGLVEAKRRAATANTFSEYKRALRYYLNGFSDGHLIAYFPVDATRNLWPGFLASEDANGLTRVALSRVESIPLGAIIESCDGVPTPHLVEERVLPYWWNRDIPHQRDRAVTRLFTIDPNDREFRLERCTFRVNGRASEMVLNWSGITSDEARNLRRETLSREVAELGLRQVGNVWFASMPTFSMEDETDIAAFNAFLDELEKNAGTIRNSALVLDVRGNSGGNSAWGDEVIKRLWGKTWYERVKAQLDQTVDWRVSTSNLKRTREVADQVRKEGLADMAADYEHLFAAMEAALAREDELLRVEQRPMPVPADVPANPVTGTVFFLTDNACFSACLDFADLVRKMPGVRHVGLPTAADAIYIENTGADLPSGLAGLSYSLKVFRNRVRAHNEWYEPHIRWPGGRMTDEAVAKWLVNLASVKEGDAPSRQVR